MIVLNDLHIGTLRAAGTTPRSAYALRMFLLDKLSECLDRIDEDLVINGDLFDAHTIPLSDFTKTYDLLRKWLAKGFRLWLVDGNHDLNSDSAKMSHFQLLAHLLSEDDKVTHVSGGQAITDEVYVISHVPNQDLFNHELGKVPKCKYLLVHVNYDNNFAKESDHSLNMSREQAAMLPVDHIYFAHEHYYREDLRGKVFIGGNQFPASISDCLHRDMKCMHRLGDKGIERIETWNPSDYEELVWNEVKDTSARFIRFVGQCTPEDSSKMMDVIARYRRASEAFIVGNAVKVIDPAAKEEEFAVNSLERVREFDVMKSLEKHLTAEEFKFIKELPSV